MIVNLSDFMASVGVCCTLLAGGYSLVISPLQNDIEKQAIVIEQLNKTASQTTVNTLTLEKQDIRIEQNRKQIQLTEINAAKREVQMTHLTEAIRQLNVILTEMKKEEGAKNG